VESHGGGELEAASFLHTRHDSRNPLPVRAWPHDCDLRSEPLGPSSCAPWPGSGPFFEEEGYGPRPGL